MTDGVKVEIMTLEEATGGLVLADLFNLYNAVGAQIDHIKQHGGEATIDFEKLSMLLNAAQASLRDRAERKHL